MREKFLSIAEYSITIILILLLLFVFQQRISNHTPAIMGYRIMYVLTGSMEPEIMAGDAVIIKDMEAKDLKAGNVVCYLAGDGEKQGSFIIHKVEKELYTEDGTDYIVTKGIANTEPDPPVSSDQVLGKVICRLHLLGKIYTFLYTIPGLIVTLMPIVFLLISEIVQIRKDLEQKENS